MLHKLIIKLCVYFAVVTSRGTRDLALLRKSIAVSAETMGRHLRFGAARLNDNPVFSHGVPDTP